jgi:hypothetical protein
MKREGPDARTVLPKVLALHEALFVSGLLGQLSRVMTTSKSDGLVNGRAEPLQLNFGEKIRDHHEPVALERFDLLGIKVA